MAELPALQELHETLKGRGLQVIGVVVDDTLENVTSAKERFGVTYPIMIDSKASSKRSFGIRGLPETFVLDSERRILIIQDPEDGELVTKIIGPREWAQKRSLQSFQALLQ
jgi:peroxiredoxin